MLIDRYAPRKGFNGNQTDFPQYSKIVHRPRHTDRVFSVCKCDETKSTARKRRNGVARARGQQSVELVSVHLHLSGLEIRGMCVYVCGAVDVVAFCIKQNKWEIYVR